MPVDSITSSTLVYATSSTSVGINNLRSNLRDLLETGYGAQLTGNDVVSGSTISAQTWTALANDFQRVLVHQQGSTQTFVTGLPDTGRILTANFAQTISSGTNLAYINSTTVAASQLGEDFNSSTRTAVWGSNISHQITYTWTSAAAARIFFNLGGYIKFNLGYPLGSYSGDDATWKVALDAAISRLSGFKYTFSQIIDPAATLYAKFEGDDNPLVWSTDSASFVYKDINNNAVKISVNKSSGILVATLTLEPVALSSINLDIISTITNYYSRGDVAVGGYLGIAAPRPQVSRTQDLSGGGVVIEPPPDTRILSVNSLSPFTLVKDSTSAAQTVTLTNNGNKSLTVTAISYSTNFVAGPGTPPVTAVPNYSGFSFPKVIPASGNASFTLAYTGNTIGSYNNNFVITSNNDSGPVTVQTQQVVSAPTFNFTLSPSNWTASVTTPDIISQKFTIVPNDGSTVGTSYTIGWGGPTPSGFSSVSTDGGPTISFNPNLVSNGSYTPTLSINYGSVTKTASINITRNLPTTFNLGSWVSPIQRYNSVVGMSYDVIAGQRYLTIGYSLGEDGSLQDAANPNYQSYLSTATLGTSADTKYSSGIVAYEMLNSPTHIQFIKDYGVWIRSNSKEPFDTYVARSYTFTAPTAGTYTWRMSVDNEGYFTIDGETIGDLRGFGNPWTYVSEETFELTAGQHTITWYAQNFSSSGSDNPGGIAIQILRTSDSLEIWNTQNAVRNTPAYQYWQEVYRMPIATNGSVQTLQSKNYLIKNSNGPYEESYGYFFGTPNTSSYGSMFTVQNDGTGLLSITFNSNWGIPANATYNSDVTKFVYLPFYYSELSGTRITNLDSGPVGDGNQTNYFLGFNSNGTVRTNLQVYPRGGTGGGSGCPDPSVLILMADYSTKAAGDLEISNMVLGIDEITGEVGPYPIIKKELILQPKVDITFTDDSVIRTSESHKFLIYQQGWKQVFDLSPGDQIQTIHASLPFKKIKSIVPIGEGTVVKLEVDIAHTYVADGLISHNAKIIDPEQNNLITA